jgi:hypothetical protein
MLRAIVIVISLLLASACSDPPSKEMHQAQGAIDAAKAAGAEQYAADELKAAVDALARADVAVSARDFRLALSHALDSRERAQDAAKAAVDGRAKARGDAERVLAETTALVDRAETRLKTADSGKLPRRTTEGVQRAVTTARTALQEARTALEQEDYARVAPVATTVAAQIEAALTALDAPPATPKGARKH